MLVWLALPADAEVVLTTEPMTGSGLPPGQTLPAAPESEAATPEPFTPKVVTAEKMRAWGPASAATTDTATDTGKPAARRVDRLRTRVREAQPPVRPVVKPPVKPPVRPPVKPERKEP